jgi:hypothetical protein
MQPEDLREDPLEDLVTLREALIKLAELLPGLNRAVAEQNALLDSLREALERHAAIDPRMRRRTYGIGELAHALGVSRRSIEREKSAGHLPEPDLVIGKRPLWRVESIDAWIGKGGRR